MPRSLHRAASSAAQRSEEGAFGIDGESGGGGGGDDDPVRAVVAFVVCEDDGLVGDDTEEIPLGLALPLLAAEKAPEEALRVSAWDGPTLKVDLLPAFAVTAIPLFADCPAARFLTMIPNHCRFCAASSMRSLA